MYNKTSLIAAMTATGIGGLSLTLLSTIFTTNVVDDIMRMVEFISNPFTVSVITAIFISSLWVIYLIFTRKKGDK